MSVQSSTLLNRRRIRRTFGKIKEVAKMPNLIEVQRNSYEQFLQMYIPIIDRIDIGLQAVFNSVFPIKDFAGRSMLEFVSYTLEEPKYDVEECHQRGLTYSSPLRLTLRLIVWDLDADTGTRSIRDMKEQDVYMGDMPLMTPNGTFVVNGTERVIVSQMHRSPGVFFDHDKGKSHASGKYLFAARVIPYRGSWLDFEFDPKDILNVRIDRRRKLPCTTLLMALLDENSEKYLKECQEKQEEPDRTKLIGMTREDILNFFYKCQTYKLKSNKWTTDFIENNYKGLRLNFDLINAKTGKVVAESGDKITPRSIKQLVEDGLKTITVDEQQLIGKFISEDIINLDSGEVYAEAGDEVNEDLINLFKINNFGELKILSIDNSSVGPWIRNTLALDKNASREESLVDIYRVMRPGEPPAHETAEALFNGLFFDQDKYDLSAVGRVKMSARLDLDFDDSLRVLRKVDILAILKELVSLKDGHGEIDDIDHLGNRRVRSVGELLENQYRVGLSRMERAIKERMSSANEIENLMPQDLINAKPAAASIREFFGSSQLSQFMDQTNPLSEITHKRRVSALGPGGLTRERAGFEVRDVHPTHYGRICPIETPEGPNIGLINSLATFAQINQYGFIETPYRKVEQGKVTKEVVYVSAIEEGKYTIAQANAELDNKDQFTDELLPVRKAGDIGLANPKDINLMDVSPKQLVSVASALIPFLENDDANRALMGSNMMRQAVPLVKSESPLVGTGIEATVAQDSGVTLVARRSGVVDQVDATRIVIRANTSDQADISPVDIYSLLKFQRSNQNTCINQRPLVQVGDLINIGDIIADGPATEDGELALGRNVLVAFMPWNGYNFEDSILISERIVKEDVFSSIHIEEFEVMARDTKLGQEEITRDIPNIGEEALRNLDEAGMVYIGAEVKPGEIMVGKVTPKGESPMTPEEKLLRAIFGEKASDVRDTSLKVPPGVSGTIVDVRVFSRRGVDKDERARAIERAEIDRFAKDRDDEKIILERAYYGRLKEYLLGKEVSSSEIKSIKNGDIITNEIISNISRVELRSISISDDSIQKNIEKLSNHFDGVIKTLENRFNDKVDKLQRGDELLPGVMKMVKVFVAVKRKLQSGDKMAGRHGNKGVISRIIPSEDMPYLEDGTPVDVVLNPLGVPSRMNVGQILETHLGWAASGLGTKINKMVYSEDNDNTKIKKFLSEIYGDKQFKSDLSNLSDDQIIQQAQNLIRGVPMATPVFDGASEKNVKDMLKLADLDETGQVWLTDGRTGEVFDRKVTVGYIYMLKLHHLVDDKIHARSIGPYSLVTQQPLGGKAQFGGQRFGEMEVWALEAYGAAYTLQEMLTVKSDDVSGRTKVYESIIKGDDDFEAGIPESFNVLIKELKSLGLNVNMDVVEQ
ncbi:DNA-directed RNA polymerase subunit beta [Alphaproteobacteria bacterium]|nr:DNA-directed RNA polymerase subunit beta [Alphaproteobacteria bacterium]